MQRTTSTSPVGHTQILSGTGYSRDGAGSEDRSLRGRDSEWKLVSELLRRAQRGFGGVLLAEGEHGAGKSALLRASRRQAAAYGFSLATGCADRLGRRLPFFALLTALNEPFDELTAEERWETPGRRIGQLQAHLEQLAAAAPALVCLDDLHWADHGTLLALRTLPRKLARCPVAWILARTTTPGDSDGELLFRLLERDGAAHVVLGPLGDEAMADVLTDAFGAPPDQDLLTLAAGAAGNPSLLTELMRGLHDDEAVRVVDGRAVLASARLPHRVSRVVRQRLDDLTGPTRCLLQAAAVRGQSFLLEDAAAVLGEPPAALLPMVEEAMAAGIVTAANDAFRFRHELMRHATADMIPAPARRALHRQFGELLLKRGGTAACAAAHLLDAASANDPAALPGLDKAAAELLPTAPQPAAQTALRAVELTPPADPGLLSREVTAVEALTAAGRLDQAARIARDALAQQPPPLPEARLRCALSSIQCMVGQTQPASAAAQAVLAQPHLPREVRDQAMTAQLQAASALGDNQAAGRTADGVLAAPAEYGRQVVGAALVARAMISWDEGRISEALEFLRDARHGARVSPDARHVQPALALAAGLVDLRLLEEAAAVVRTVDSTILQGAPAQVVRGILQARTHLAMGRLNEAAIEGEAALGAATALGANGHAAVACCILAMVALRYGDLAAAARHLASRPVRPPHLAAGYARAAACLAEAQIVEASDGPVAALGHIREVCADLAAHRGRLLGEPAVPAWLVRTALAAGDHELAAQVADCAGTLARDNPGVAVVAAAAAHCLGVLWQDPARLSQAASQHQDLWARASAVEDLGVLLMSHADKDQAVRQLDEALDGYRRAGAVLDMARIRSRLRRLGVRRRHWASSADKPVKGWDSLTGTECAVSELVAQGLNNQQIAGRMYISAHTVAFHLRQVFRKLNIGSRVELTRIVMGRAQDGDG